MNSEYVEVFSGSAIISMAVKDVLSQNKIPFVERNDVKSAVAGGYGTAGSATHIFVKSEYEKQALEVIQTLNL